MINRINLILQAKNITARQFAEEIGIQPSGMSHILGGRNNPSLDFVQKVIRRYPEIDANWLLLGRGAMYTSTSTDAQVDAPVDTTPQMPSKPTMPSLFSGLDTDGMAAASPGAAATPPPDQPTAAPLPPTSTPSPADAEPMRASAHSDMERLRFDADHGNLPHVPTLPPMETEPPTALTRAEPSTTAATRHLVQVLLVYSDHTFETLRPADA